MTLKRLIDENSTELECLDITIHSIDELREIIADNEPDNIQKAAMNQFISEFYNGIENCLKRICKYNQFPLPHGGAYHIDIFNLFTKRSQSDLPLLITPDIEDELINVRKFRHFVIHGYSFRIDWAYLKDSVAKIDGVYQIFKSNIIDYINSLE